MKKMTAEEMAVAAARAADSKKADHICVIDVSGVFDFTDYILLASGRTDRQVSTVADHIREKLREDGTKPLRVEGNDHNIWVVMDFGGLMVHVLRLDEYDYYQLDRLWKDLPRLEWEPHS